MKSSNAKCLSFSKKGFVISFDAIIALFVIFAFLASSFVLFSSVEEKNSTNALLQDYSFDVLKVLEKSGKLEKAVISNDASAVNAFLNLLPKHYCARIEFFEENSKQPMLVAAVHSCSNTPENVFLARRFFFTDHNDLRVYYIVELKSWFKD